MPVQPHTSAAASQPPTMAVQPNSTTTTSAQNNATLITLPGLALVSGSAIFNASIVTADQSTTVAAVACAVTDNGFCPPAPSSLSITYNPTMVMVTTYYSGYGGQSSAATNICNYSGSGGMCTYTNTWFSAKDKPTTITSSPYPIGTVTGTFRVTAGAEKLSAASTVVPSPSSTSASASASTGAAVPAGVSHGGIGGVLCVTMLALAVGSSVLAFGL